MIKNNMVTKKSKSIVSRGIRVYENNPVFFWLVAFVIVGLFSFLFLNQATHFNSYKSDVIDHIKITIVSHKKQTYSLLHKLIKMMAKVFMYLNSSHVDKEPSIILTFFSSIISLSVLFSMVFVKNILNRFYPNASALKKDVSVFTLFFVSMIIIDFSLYVKHYLGIGTPNPLHNPTFIFARPFAILLFYKTSEMISNFIIKKDDKISFFILPILSVLSMWAKPSFLLSFIPATLFLLFILILQKRINIYKAILLSTLLLFSMIPLYYISLKVFSNEANGNKVILSFATAWSYYYTNIGFSIILAGLFPIYTYGYSIYYQIKNKIKVLEIRHTLALLNYLFGILIFLLFYEDGPRAFDGNFGWTYLFSLFFIFLNSIDLFLFSKRISYPKILLGIFLALHLISGIYYFTIVFLGYS